MGKINIIAGAIIITAFTVMAFVLQAAGTHEFGPLWRAAHVHGALFGMLNMVLGLSIIALKLDGKLISVSSILAVIGAVLLPGGLFVGVYNPSLLVLAPLGGLSLVIALLIFCYGVIKA